MATAGEVLLLVTCFSNNVCNFAIMQHFNGKTATAVSWNFKNIRAMAVESCDEIRQVAALCNVTRGEVWRVSSDGLLYVSCVYVGGSWISHDIRPGWKNLVHLRQRLWLSRKLSGMSLSLSVCLSVSVFVFVCLWLSAWLLAQQENYKSSAWLHLLKVKYCWCSWPL